LACPQCQGNALPWHDSAALRNNGDHSNTVSRTKRNNAGAVERYEFVAYRTHSTSDVRTYHHVAFWPAVCVWEAAFIRTVIFRSTSKFSIWPAIDDQQFCPTAYASVQPTEYNCVWPADDICIRTTDDVCVWTTVNNLSVWPALLWPAISHQCFWPANYVRVWTTFDNVSIWQALCWSAIIWSDIVRTTCVCVWVHHFNSFAIWPKRNVRF
jgi:hypothetical protein